MGEFMVMLEAATPQSTVGEGGGAFLSFLFVLDPNHPTWLPTPDTNDCLFFFRYHSFLSLLIISLVSPSVNPTPFLNISSPRFSHSAFDGWTFEFEVVAPSVVFF